MYLRTFAQYFVTFPTAYILVINIRNMESPTAWNAPVLTLSHYSRPVDMARVSDWYT